MPRPRPEPTVAADSRRNLDERSVRPSPPAAGPPPSGRPCPQSSGRTFHTAPPAIVCWDFRIGGGVVLAGLAFGEHGAGRYRHGGGGRGGGGGGRTHCRVLGWNGRPWPLSSRRR